jgi:hypothetical protein
MGINAFNYGTGDITVSNSGGITANAVATTTTTTAQYGIGAFNYGIGNITVVGASGSTISSGSTGILASNQATVIDSTTPTSVNVTSLGTITSGTNLNNGGSAPAGIIANINPGGTGTYNGGVYGNVLVTAGSVTANAGSGIRAANDGIGNVAVNLVPNAIISALNSSSAASNNAPYGVNAIDLGAGDVAVTTSNGDIINSGSDGINANNQATAIAAAADALVTVNAAGSINSGNVQNNSGSAPAGIRAGFLGGTSTVANLNVNGTVIINSTAAISAAAGYGINAYNFGNGDITINSTRKFHSNHDYGSCRIRHRRFGPERGYRKRCHQRLWRKHQRHVELNNDHEPDLRHLCVQQGKRQYFHPYSQLELNHYLERRRH